MDIRAIFRMIDVDKSGNISRTVRIEILQDNDDGDYYDYYDDDGDDYDDGDGGGYKDGDYDGSSGECDDYYYDVYDLI